MIVFLLIGGAKNGRKRLTQLFPFITITSMAKESVLSNWNEI